MEKYGRGYAYQHQNDYYTCYFQTVPQGTIFIRHISSHMFNPQANG